MIETQKPNNPNIICENITEKNVQTGEIDILANIISNNNYKIDKEKYSSVKQHILEFEYNNICICFFYSLYFESYKVDVFYKDNHIYLEVCEKDYLIGILKKRLDIDKTRESRENREKFNKELSQFNL